jgi:hypothetical protein
MIKLLRKGAIEKPWVIRIIMIVISLAFVITMGWWGFSGPASQFVVAEVGTVPITLPQYQQAYDSTYNFYRNLFKDQFNEDLVQQLDLKKTVVNNLIEKQLWLVAAEKMRVEVSDQELSDFIVKQQTFHREGRFDPEIYRRVLAVNRYTPEAFERLQREDLAVEKVKTLLRESVIVTGIESRELQSQLVSDEETASADNQKQLQGLLLRKQEMALETYLNTLRRQIPITVNETLL